MKRRIPRSATREPEKRRQQDYCVDIAFRREYGGQRATHRLSNHGDARRVLAEFGERLSCIRQPVPRPRACERAKRCAVSVQERRVDGPSLGVKSLRQRTDRLRGVTEAVQDENTAPSVMQPDWFRAFDDIGVARRPVGSGFEARATHAMGNPGCAGQSGGKDA